ncbi:EamA family transporter [Thermodesulfobacteriota bacterium]
MTGSMFALLSALCFALTTVFTRRAVLKVSDASLGTLISVPMAVPFFVLILVFSGQLQSVLSFPWQSYVWLSAAGILHFVVGRSLFYKCVQLVGGNIAGILRRVNILVAVVIGISCLHEPLTWRLAIGVLLITIGITLTGLNPRLLQLSGGRFSKIPAKAFVFGFGCGVAWGVSPIFVSLGVKGSGAPVAGALISFLAATAVLSISLLNHRRRTSMADITGKAAGLFFIVGFIGFLANLARYVALSLAPASIVAPLVTTAPVLLLVFSFVFNRKLEIFSKPIIIGTITVVIGSILLV